MSIHKTALRLPKELHQQIVDAAKESGISMNAEIVTRLKKSFEIEQQIIKGIDDNDAHTKKLMKDSFLEMLKDLENEGKVIITKDLGD